MPDGNKIAQTTLCANAGSRIYLFLAELEGTLAGWLASAALTTWSTQAPLICCASLWLMSTGRQGVDTCSIPIVIFYHFLHQHSCNCNHWSVSQHRVHIIIQKVEFKIILKADSCLCAIVCLTATHCSYSYCGRNKKLAAKLRLKPIPWQLNLYDSNAQ